MPQNTVIADTQTAKVAEVKPRKMTADDYIWQAHKSLFFAFIYCSLVLLPIGTSVYSVVLLLNNKGLSWAVASGVEVIYIICADMMMFGAVGCFTRFGTNLINYHEALRRSESTDK